MTLHFVFFSVTRNHHGESSVQSSVYREFCAVIYLPRNAVPYCQQLSQLFSWEASQTAWNRVPLSLWGYIFWHALQPMAPVLTVSIPESPAASPPLPLPSMPTHKAFYNENQIVVRLFTPNSCRMQNVEGLAQSILISKCFIETLGVFPI